MKTNKITLWVLIALVLGITVGYFCHANITDAKQLKDVAGYFSILTDVFLRLIKMIIAPLVMSTLVHGIASSDSRSVGRVGLKAMAWFLCASLVSLFLGLFFANLLQPGVGYNLPLPDVTATSGVKASALNLKDFITHMFPTSFFDAMSKNEVLQVVVFSVFFGVGIITYKGEKPTFLIKGLEELSNIMLRITNIVMMFAPLGVFGAVASTVTTEGLGVLTVYAKFMGSFYLALLTLWILMISGGYAFVGRKIFALLKMIRMPLMLGFATASSEAAYPQLLEQLERFGIKEKISGFVLPLGYSFNLDGSIMYTSFAALFISQVFHVNLTLTQQITMLLILLVTSKGIAGVPRASLVVVAAVLPMFNLPDAGILLILGIDHFLDMGRTATNVLGNAIATTVVAGSEGEIDREAAMQNPVLAEDRV
ncbi:dicarboxylate/amino acid:cation symporter [uncultured Aquitalea sp.]|uniref:dicarboxylate/amino acid:cation symporter n=1 Tax=uncultured Aquitalea sp. TaxID=540272 RepID=UPI0025DB22AC|nr:dicarboxylate/amino acid:cation symporter [uncultured Aquitalea sp.]